MVDEVVRHLNKDIVLTSFGAELIEAVVLKEIFKLKVVYLYYPFSDLVQKHMLSFSSSNRVITDSITSLSRLEDSLS